MTDEQVQGDWLEESALSVAQIKALVAAHG
jgi:hypothetical protein